MIIKKQHWVPATYLKFFTLDCARDSTLHVYDSELEKWRESSPNYECKEVDFYRIGLTNDGDIIKTTFEDKYDKIASKIVNDKWVSGYEKFFIFTFIIHMSVRNKAFNNKTSLDRMEVFEKLFDTIAGRLLQNVNKVEEFGEEKFNEIWDLRIIKNNKIWWTSDNPACFYKRNIDKSVMIGMPIGPRHFALCVRKEYLRFLTTSATAQDTIILNSTPYGQRIKFAYSPIQSPLSGSVKHKIKDGDRPVLSDDTTLLSYALYEKKLSFLREIKKVLIPVCL